MPWFVSDMPRSLGIDPGRRRVGLALSDETGVIATPLTVVDRTEEDLGDRLRTVIREHDVDHVVVGYPKPLRTEQNERTRQVDEFIRSFVEPLSVPHTIVSERYSSREANQRRRQREGEGTAGDDEAAALILDRYLQSDRAGETGDDD